MKIGYAMRRRIRPVPGRKREPITAGGFSEWTRTGILLCLSTIAVALLCWSTIWTLVHAWAQSRTYAHGFLTFPMVLYMSWEYRDRWIGLIPRLDRRGILVGVVSLLIGFGGRLMEADLLQQASLLAMLPALVFACCGTEVFQAVRFPLGVLVFGLPIGSGFEPALQSFTAGFIALALHVASVPFQQDGYFITLSSGTWEVATDCGGLRYILPGLACGYVFTGLVHHKTVQRMQYLLLCTMTLSVANGLRAAGIVLSDHFDITNGVDHRLFSYVVYGVTIFFLAWLGLVWRRDDIHDGTGKGQLTQSGAT